MKTLGCQFLRTLFVGIFLMCGCGWTQVKSVTISQLKETIKTVRSDSSSDVRYRAAQHLADLTRAIDPRAVDDKTLADMVSLLDTNDDSVRLFVAGALGFLGPRAKVAVPKLLKILPEVDC